MDLSRKRPDIVRRTAVASALAGALALSPAAFGAATQTGSTLTVTETFVQDGLYDIDILPGGRVVVQIAPDVPGGQTFTGVTELRILSKAGNDTLDLDLTGSMRIVVDDQRGDNTVKANVRAPAAGTMAVSLSALLSTATDNVEVLAHTQGASLDLDVAADTSTGSDQVKVEVTGEGRAPWLSADLRAVGGTGEDSAELLVASDAPSVSVGMDTFVDSAKLVVDHKAPGIVDARLNMRGEQFDNSVSAELKGSESTKRVSGLLFGGFWHDSVTLLTEGSAVGNPLVDGGQGTDSCSATLGTVVNCE